MTRPRRIGLLKPDHGGFGGFERLCERVTTGLRAQGLEVEQVTFDARAPGAELYGLPVGAQQHAHDEFFLQLAGLERLDRMDLGRYDTVIATQPPTYLADHPDVVALFYHQARVFYELADAFVRSGFVDPEVHRAAVEEIRAIDLARVGNVRAWLAGSHEAAARLERYWGITSGVTVHRAGPEPSTLGVAADYDPAGPAVCVSRHEWPKRTELVVQAATADPSGTYLLAGGGSRLPWLAHLAHRYRRDPSAVETDPPEATWCNTGTRQLVEPPPPWNDQRLQLLGEVSDRRRDELYASAAVVLAPALREDYGLTAAEAFVHGRPVVVCDDGGGLVELVGDTGAGLVVPPAGRDIARAVAELRADPERSREMAEAAHQVASTFREDTTAAHLAALVSPA